MQFKVFAYCTHYHKKRIRNGEVRESRETDKLSSDEASKYKTNSFFRIAQFKIGAHTY